MPRTKVTPDAAATAAAAVAGIENVGRAAAGRPRPPRPYSVEPRMTRGLAAVVELVVPERGIDIEQQWKELEAALTVEGALTPQVVKAQLNLAEKRALAAHRLYVFAKLEQKRYSIDCEEALGSMRDFATSELQAEKDRGERNKSITEADVRGRAATLYPDEWAAINTGLESSKATIAHLEQLSDLWKGRRFSLAALLGDGR